MNSVAKCVDGVIAMLQNVSMLVKSVVRCIDGVTAMLPYVLME